MDKTGRNGLRVGDCSIRILRPITTSLRQNTRSFWMGLHFQEDVSAMEEEFFEALEFMRAFKIVQGEYFINEKLSQGKKVLAEGAQGSMLDVDFGTFPFVTSSNTISAGVCTGLGVAPQQIREVIGVTKAYCTRVGSGPFPTELENETGDRLRKAGSEFGATTGRPRRCGWIDLVALRYACMINGVTKLVMTKADVLDDFEKLKMCTKYRIEGKETEEVPFQMLQQPIEPVLSSFEGWKKDITTIKDFHLLPEEMKTYISFIDSYLKVNVSYISNGPGRDQLIEKQ